MRPIVKSQAAYPSELAAPEAGASTATPPIEPTTAAAPPPGAMPATPAPAGATTGEPAAAGGSEVRAGRTGIVVVHGIGSQKPAETVLQWTAPLIEILTAWRRDVAVDPSADDGRPIDPVRSAAIDFESPFPTVSLHIPAARIGDVEHPPREWLVTEAWWASNVEPPGLSTMITWLGPGGGVGRIVDGILGNEDSGRWLGGVLRAFLVPLVSVLAGLLLTLYGLLRSVSAIIPIQALREATVLRQFDEFLIGWFGDVRILLFDPAQSANIRGGLAGAVRRLRERCDEVVVVAHSGGAMISYLTLTDPELAPDAQVDKLITFGEGWNLALRLTPDGAGMADRLRRDITASQPRLRWHDFHASHDPAPAGPLALQEIRPAVLDPSRIRTVRIWNRRSVLGDHGGYFDNDEEFTLPILRELDTPSGWGETSRFYPPDAGVAAASMDPANDPDQRVRRHRQRVALLALWRYAVLCATIATIAFALGWVPGRLVDIGRQVGSLLPRIPIVADAVDAVRAFATDTLETLEFSLPLIGHVPPGALASAVDGLGIGVLQGVVLMAVLFLIAARARAFLAWPPGRRIGVTIRVVEIALLAVVIGSVVSIAIAPDHGRLVGAGLLAWTPGVAVTALTGLIALLGTSLASTIRSSVVSNGYASVASVLFLTALGCSVLTVLRDPEREWAQLAYVVIWIGTYVLLGAGAARWSAWDRSERRIAYGPVGAIPVERRPVLVTSSGLVVLAATLMVFVLAGPNELVIYAALAAGVLIAAGAIFGATVWKGVGNPVAAPGAVDSARGSV